MAKTRDPLLKQESTISDMLLAFLFSGIFGIVAFFPWMMLKDALPMLIRALGGYQFAHNAFVITFTIGFGILWLVLTTVLWHKLEKDFHLKKALITTAIWCGWALLVYVIAVGLRVLSDVLLR